MDKQFAWVLFKIWLITIPVLAFILPQGLLVEHFLPAWAEWPAVLAISLELVMILALLIPRLSKWIDGE